MAHWFRWHSWIGLTAGLLLFVICWSGTVAVFSREIDWLLNPVLRVRPHASRASWGEILAAVERAYPQGKVSSLHAPLGPRFAAEASVEARGQTLRVYVNPYTAQVRGETSYFNVQRFFRSFHMNLFFPRTLGYYVVCAFSFALIASMATALLFYHHWWRRFFILKIGRGPRVFWSDLHKASGLWSIWFCALIAVTGLWYLIEIFGYDWISPQFSSKPAPALSAAEKAAWMGKPPLPLDDLVAHAQRARPELTIQTVSLPDGEANDLIYFDGQGDDLLVRNRANKLYLNLHTGEVAASQDAGDLSLYWRWVDTADPLHFGDFGGLISKSVWFLFGILLSGLSLTGAYLQVQRQQRRGQDGYRSAIIAAYTVSILVLLTAAVGAWREIRDYGPVEAEGRHVWPEVPLAVVGFIVVWLASMLVILVLWVRKLR